MKRNKKIDLKLSGEPIRQVIRIGGYYIWDLKFPFRHFKEEELLLLTKGGLYKFLLSNKTKEG